MTEGNGTVSSWIAQLGAPDAQRREQAAREIFRQGCAAAEPVLAKWFGDPEFRALARSGNTLLTVGLAVTAERFKAIRAACGNPRLAEVPPDQDAMEFTVEFGHGVRLDILTAKDASAQGAIARYLERFGEGIQQIECDVRDIERATQLLGERFELQPIYPETHDGADGTRVNFFLVPIDEERKLLMELVEVRGGSKKPSRR